MKKIVAISAFFVALAAPLTASYAHGEDRTIEIHARRYSFEPAEISVTNGETVKLKLISDDVPHSLLIKDLGIDQLASKNHPAEFSFTPSHAGDFKGQCGRFCGIGHGSMHFVVHVKEH